MYKHGLCQWCTCFSHYRHFYTFNTYFSDTVAVLNSSKAENGTIRIGNVQTSEGLTSQVITGLCVGIPVAVIVIAGMSS